MIGIRLVSEWFPALQAGLEVSNKKYFWFYITMNVPMYLIRAVLSWKMSPSNLGLLSTATTYNFYLVLCALFVFQFSSVYYVNKDC
jgi:NNP family nitrate/nitrite transporter-like MFS transporter